MADTVTYDDLIDVHDTAHINAQAKVTAKIINEMARVGYDAMYEDGWCNLSASSQERVIWQRTMRAVLDYLVSISDD